MCAFLYRLVPPVCMLYTPVPRCVYPFHVLCTRSTRISMDPVTIQWVECSRCEKWRIIPARPDGVHEDVPDVWYCEMNSDTERNFCDAPEQEYVEPAAPVLRLPRSNDPEGVRARLKMMSLGELQAAFDSFDLKSVLRDELGSSLPPVVTPSLNHHHHVASISRLEQEAACILPAHICKQFVKR